MPRAKAIVFGCQVRSTLVRDICYKLSVAVPLALWVKQLTSCYYHCYFFGSCSFDVMSTSVRWTNT